MYFSQKVRDFAKVALDYYFQAQYEKGMQKYNTFLTTFNGRDAFDDAMQESMDLTMYLNQLRLERNVICRIICNGIALDELPENVKEYIVKHGTYIALDKMPENMKEYSEKHGNCTIY